jgi:hypothetical protein
VKEKRGRREERWQDWEGRGGQVRRDRSLCQFSKNSFAKNNSPKAKIIR